MQLPKLELSFLPDLNTLTGLFGSTPASGPPGHDDSIIILATYVYELSPPAAPEILAALL